MYKNLHIPLLMLAAAAMIIAGCKKAPEPQPLVIRATLSNPEASPQSRATIDGTFDGGEEFGIAVNGGGIYHYTADTDGTLTSEAPYYWAAGSSDQYIDIRAWSPYDGENDIPSAADKILPDQSTLQAYRSSDLIVATGTLTPGNTALRFTHATARLTFNLKSDSSEPLTAISDVKVAGISSLPSGTAITPYRPAPSANSFSALVPDGTIPAGAEVLTFKREGFNYSWTADKDYALSPDTGYTFDISVSTDKPQITLTGCTISGWKPGANYEENVPIPDTRVPIYVNLAELLRFLRFQLVWDQGDGWQSGHPPGKCADKRVER